MAFKRSLISDNLEDYALMLCGESGCGKTTVISSLCEMEFGEDGYVLLNTGDEDGVSAIDGVTYEDVPTYKKYVEVCDDIIKNKATEYPNLKVVIIDTLDQLIKTAEKFAIDDWNRSNSMNKNFKKAKSLNSVEGGFGAGYDLVFDLIYNKVRALDKIGVKTWFVCHSKTKDIVDPLTSASYTTLTSNMAQRYFNDFKTKVHVLGVCCIDRTIDTVATGRKDIKNNDITINKIQAETRQIVFRDDSYSVDSKSRFAGIVDRIPLDAVELQKALKDAIKNSKKSEVVTPIPTPTPKKSAPVPTPEPEDEDSFEEEPAAETYEEDPEIEATETTESTADKEAKIEECRSLFKTADKTVKADVKKLLNGGKLDIEMDDSVLGAIYNLLTSSEDDEV